MTLGSFYVAQISVVTHWLFVSIDIPLPYSTHLPYTAPAIHPLAIIQTSNAAWFLTISCRGSVCSEERPKIGGYKKKKRYKKVQKGLINPPVFFISSPFHTSDMAPHALLHKQAPTDITLKNQHSQDISVSDFIGKSTVVLFFYPKDNTYVCSKEVMPYNVKFKHDFFNGFYKTGLRIPW